MSVFFRVAFVVLRQPAAKARDQPAQVCYLQPGFAAKLLSVVHCEQNLSSDTVASEPGYHP